MLMDQQAHPNTSVLTLSHTTSTPTPPQHLDTPRRHLYDTRLTQLIWSLATAHANPAVDLVVCLERNRDIGYRYVDITRSVVIHHGSRDTRVPVENVRGLGRAMRRCEVRVLEGEGHGLMARGGVVADVLGEIAGEWEGREGRHREGGAKEGRYRERDRDGEKMWEKGKEKEKEKERPATFRGLSV